MKLIKRIAAIILLTAAVALVMTSCALREGEVSEKEWDAAVALSEKLSGFTQTIISPKDNSVIHKCEVKFDSDTLYRIDYGPDGKTLNEFYFQKDGDKYTQYLNVYTASGHPQSWRTNKASASDWEEAIAFLYGIDDKYGLEEFIVYSDYTFVEEDHLYYAKDIPVMMGGVFFTDVYVRFEGKNLVELNLTQSYGWEDTKLCHTFSYDDGELTVPEDVLK